MRGGLIFLIILSRVWLVTIRIVWVLQQPPLISSISKPLNQVVKVYDHILNICQEATYKDKYAYLSTNVHVPFTYKAIIEGLAWICLK